MTFNFFSLDYFYYPVSGIMWVWHKIFGSFMGPSNAWAWVLSVVFLVFTLRIVLFKPFLKQMDSQLKMQAIQPQMKKLREKYKDDRQRLSEEMMKLNKEAGVNPLASCLPALIQMPVFLSLYHVLKSFKPGWGQVYFFGASDVQSFVDAKLFGGAPLSSFISMPSKDRIVNGAIQQVGLESLGGVRSTVIAVCIPLMILASIATYLTSRRSVARQREMGIDNTGNAQAAIMNKLMLYVFPLGVLVGGIFFPIANLFYWLSNNTWTFGQLSYAHRRQDKVKAMEAKVVEEAKEATRFTRPPPGAKPVKNPRGPVVSPTPLNSAAPADKPAPVDKANGSVNGSAGSHGPVDASTNGSAAVTDSVNGGTVNGGSVNGAKANGGRVNGGSANGATGNGAAATPTGSRPQPGARPVNRTGGSSGKRKKPRY